MVSTGMDQIVSYQKLNLRHLEFKFYLNCGCNAMSSWMQKGNLNRAGSCQNRNQHLSVLACLCFCHV